MIETEKKDKITLILNKLLDYAFRAAAIAKEKQTNIEMIIYVDNEGNDAVAIAYDYNIIQMRSTTTFDSLAKEYLGDPSLGPLIAYYNKIQNEHEVESGSEIRIPILTRTQNNQGNKIYASPEMQDNYGRDIALNDNGGFTVDAGDFAIVKGRKNLSQAMGSRFTTSTKKRIRLGAYGIRATIGDPLAVNSFLLGSIEQTAYEDPRIDRVDDINFQGKGDALFISVTYTDINGNQDTYKGEING
jgi:hypothetical protein